MKITISGCKIAPSWTTIQTIVRESVNDEGYLTRIARRDGACNYRATGHYDMTFTPTKGDALNVELVVTEEEGV